MDNLKDAKAMAGEVLAWLDEKDWTDEEKVAVTAGCFPILLARVAKSREAMQLGLEGFIKLMRATSDAAWKMKSEGLL